MTKPKIAVVYDWLTTRYGGAELVLQALHREFPEAHFFTSVVDYKAVPWLSSSQVTPTFLQKIPGAVNHFRLFGWLMPLAFESLDLRSYDIVISVTSSFAKSVLTQPHQLHVSYMLNPNRHLSLDGRGYLQSLPQWLRPLLKPVVRYLRHQDQVAAHRPDVIIPISALVAQRIQKAYQRTTDKVIYPPALLPSKVPPKEQPGQPQYLVVSRLVPYKRIDLAIAACQQLQRRLTIIGTGPELSHLRRQATSDLIEFKENVSAAELKHMYSQSTALLMPGLEDFGITSLEAAGHGVPVILHQESGAAEILRPGKEAVFIPKSTLAELIKAMHTLEATTWSPAIMNQHVAQYSVANFQTNVRHHLDFLWKSWTKE